MKFFETRNDLSRETRTAVAHLLQARLADLADLYTQVKQAHWNVKGPNFIALHKLFDDVAADVLGYVDETAERIVQLGGVALGTARATAKASSLSEYPLDISDGADHVQAVSTALAATGKAVRAAIDATTEHGDAGTADLLTNVSQALDKWLWFVEAHGQAKR